MRRRATAGIAEVDERRRADREQFIARHLEEAHGVVVALDEARELAEQVRVARDERLDLRTAVRLATLPNRGAAYAPELQTEFAKSAYETFVAEVQAVLRRDFPKAPASRIRETAYVLVCLVEQNKAMQREPVEANSAAEDRRPRVWAEAERRDQRRRGGADIVAALALGARPRLAVPLAIVAPLVLVPRLAPARNDQATAGSWLPPVRIRTQFRCRR